MQRKIRVIPRLDIKGPNLIKGIHLEGLRVVGDPQQFAQKYYEDGADELLYMDIVASLYGRNNLYDIIEKATKGIFIPITVGGGIKTVEDIQKALLAGAEKVALNTEVIKNPEIISSFANKFGSQCIMISIEAKKLNNGTWECLTNNGRDRTGLNSLEWAKEVEKKGAGEILLTSVDQEGTNKGYDEHLAAAISQNISLPVIISGGMGKCDHALDVIKNSEITGISMADVLHWNKMSIPDIKSYLLKNKISVRAHA